MTPGNKLLAIIGLVIVLGGGIAIKVYKSSHSPERMMAPVVEAIITKIANAQWNGAALYKYSTPEFQAWLAEHNLTNGMPGFSIMGKVKKFRGIKQIQIDQKGDFVVLVAAFQFEKTNADITMQMVKRYGRWMIYSFNIDSPIFRQTKAASTPPPVIAAPLVAPPSSVPSTAPPPAPEPPPIGSVPPSEQPPAHAPVAQ